MNQLRSCLLGKRQLAEKCAEELEEMQAKKERAESKVVQNLVELALLKNALQEKLVSYYYNSFIVIMVLLSSESRF